MSPAWRRFGGARPAAALASTSGVLDGAFDAPAADPRGLRQRAGGLIDRHHAAGALLLYLLAASLIQRHALAHIHEVIAGNLVSDPTQFFWTMWWWPHAILHGENPLYTHAIWAGDGLNMAAVTGLPLPSILCAPITALFGPIVSYNVICLLAPVLSAWLTYRLCLRLTGDVLASVAGGWLFGFCSYGLSQLIGHVNLTLTFGAPALLLLVTRWLQQTMSTRRFVVLVAVSTAAQLLCNPEILFSTSFFGAIAILCGLALTRGAQQQRLLRLIGWLVVGYAVMAVVCSPYLVELLRGPKIGEKSYIGSPADLLSFVFPTPITWIGGKWFQSVSGAYLTPPTETGTYVGFLGVLLFVCFVAESWGRSVLAKALVVTTLTATVLSLGLSLNLAGHATIWMPFHLLSRLPAFSQTLPVRFSMIIELGVAIAGALWLSSARAPLPRARRAALVVAAIVMIWPNVDGSLPAAGHTFDETYAQLPFFTHAGYRRYLRRGEVIVPIPYGETGPSLLWQAQAHGYFNMASGWFGYIPPDYLSDPITQQLLGLGSYANEVGSMESFLFRRHVGAVVIEDGQGGPWPGMMAELGLTAHAVGGVTVYDVPAAMRRSYPPRDLPAGDPAPEARSAA